MRNLIKVLLDWKKECGDDNICLFDYRYGTLTICTSRPGIWIGYRGKLVNKYKEIIQRDCYSSLQHVKFVETDRHFLL